MFLVTITLTIKDDEKQPYLMKAEMEHLSYTPIANFFATDGGRKIDG